jgi:hypothetical protein
MHNTWGIVFNALILVLAAARIARVVRLARP